MCESRSHANPFSGIGGSVDGLLLVWLVTSCPRTQTHRNGAEIFEESHSFRRDGKKTSIIHVFHQDKKKELFEVTDMVKKNWHRAICTIPDTDFTDDICNDPISIVTSPDVKVTKSGC